ncbi:hypothetical protein ACLB2K_041001 [Fragaria x ananassa]
MAASLLLRRRVSSAGVSRTLQGLAGNVKPFCLHLELKVGALVSVSDKTRFYSSSGGTTSVDFLDLTSPHTWYPKARSKPRKVILHMGPTNSGKTHNALKRLESSPSGIYCGPLRLLAWEVAKRLNKAKVPCDLLTGQEREEVDGAKHKAVTVEMADVTSNYHCAVIDEIQAELWVQMAKKDHPLKTRFRKFWPRTQNMMLGCRNRGFSFTRALLGISADELHVCGDPAAIPLIKKMLKVTSDQVEVQCYERLSPLAPMKVPLGSFSNIRTGDCIVTFSRREIYRLKATMFNDSSSELDVLVASDAIGMGLNLNISRIIFSTMTKFDGIENRELTVPEIKQIADLLAFLLGRAGRYGSRFPVGEVTCLDAADLPLLHSSLNSPSPTLEEHFVENATLSENYFIADCEEIMKVATLIDELPLGLHDKYLFCISPVDMNDDISSQGLTQFAQNYAKRGIVPLREIFTPGTLQIPKTPAALKELESIHKVLDLYVWLSFRLEESFPDRELASSQKSICHMLIEEFLERFGLQMHKPKAKRLASKPTLTSLLSQINRTHL